MSSSKREEMELRERAIQLAIAASKEDKIHQHQLVKDAAAIAKFIAEGA